MKTSGILTVSTRKRGMSVTMSAMPKMFIVKFKNTDLYSFVDDAVLADILKDSFPQAVVDVREIGNLKEYWKKNDALPDVPETDG